MIGRDISTVLGTKSIRFWNIAQNAAFCFVCCLFDEGPGSDKTQNAWVESDVNKWHKMKSVGKEKDRKLAQHFSSNYHQIALSD